jgi:mRNA interferase YafQ
MEYKKKKNHKYRPDYSTRFNKDVILLWKRWYDLTKLYGLIDLLLSWEKLSAQYKDHSLKWDLKHYRDVHIEPDWILIYRYIDYKWEKIVYFLRTWTHSDLY